MGSGVFYVAIALPTPSFRAVQLLREILIKNGPIRMFSVSTVQTV